MDGWVDGDDGGEGDRVGTGAGHGQALWQQSFPWLLQLLQDKTNKTKTKPFVVGDHTKPSTILCQASSLGDLEVRVKVPVGRAGFVEEEGEEVSSQVA